MQVYSTAASGMGSLLSVAMTSARIPLQSTPRWQPIGMKVNAVAFLSMSGLTVQSALPFDFRFSVTFVLSKVRVLCVPAT